MGQICQHYGWTIEYTLSHADWRILQRMLLDSPDYDGQEDNKTKKIDLEEQTAEDITKHLNEWLYIS